MKDNKINFDEINNLCDYFYDFLIKKKILSVFFSELLYLVSPHPVILKKYDFLIKKNKFFFVKVIYLIIKNFSIILIRFFKKNNYHIKLQNNQSLKKNENLFFSHLVNYSHLNLDKDFYFGELMNINNHNSIKILNNETEYTSRHLFKKYKNKNNVIFLTKFSGIVDELKIFFRILIDTIQLLKLKLYFKKSKDKLFLEALIIDILSQSTFKNFRLEIQLKNILKTVSPKNIIFTFEGQCYEKIIINTTKKINPTIKCIAYQHSILFPKQPSLLNKKKYINLPDTILTSGKIGENKLKKIFTNVKVLEVGNPRHLISFKETKNIENNCLLLPDGTIDEAKKMLKLIPTNINLDKRFKFIVRFHPGVSDYFKKNYNKNLIFSDLSLSDDISRCKWAVYRGSGAIIHCLRHGIRPIYYSYNNEETSIDPLYDLKDYKEKINNFSELIEIMKNDYDKNYFQLRKNDIQKFIKFSEDYFSEIDYNKFKLTLV